MFTVSFADKVSGATKPSQEGGTDEHCAGLEEGGHWSAGLGGGSGGGGWSWVDLGAPHPTPPSNPHQAGLRSRLPLPTYLALQLTLEKKAKDKGKGVIKAWDDTIAGKKWDSAHLKKNINYKNELIEY